MDLGFFHPDRGYWQTTDDVGHDIVSAYPEGTVEVPLKPVDDGTDFKLVDGEWIALAPDLDALRTARISAMSKMCAAAITGGFVSHALGAAHTYPSKQTDQSNLLASVMASVLPGIVDDWSTPFWCADEAGEWAFRPHSAAEIQTVGSDGKAHVVACQSRLDALTNDVLSAATPAEIAAITWAA